jgi:actin-related protein
MALIIDNGSHSIKYGLSSDKSPLLLESVVGFERGIKPLELSNIIIGMDAIKKLRKDPNKIVSTRYPLQRGVIVDWTQMEALWRHCFSQVATKSPYSKFNSCLVSLSI